VITIGLFAIGDLLHAAADVPQAPSPHFEFCQGVRLSFCVIDGDTIRWRGEVVRLQDIDAPEIGDFKCASELARGNQATSRLRELLNGGAIELVHTGGRDEDRYGRKLRTVRNGQRSLGDILVGEGLARPWNGACRGWCT
jgi:micrococcal nuclease